MIVSRQPSRPSLQPNTSDTCCSHYLLNPMTTHQTARGTYSAQELHRLRATCSQPKLREAIEKHEGEDADLVKGSLVFHAPPTSSTNSTNATTQAPLGCFCTCSYSRRSITLIIYIFQFLSCSACTRTVHPHTIYIDTWWQH